MNKIKRVAAYIRVSSDEQADKGYSLSAQKSRIAEYAKQNNLKIVDWYEDAGVSGHQPMKRRPELMRMVKDAERGLFEHIVFIKLDRFFRKMSEYYECMRRISPVTWIATEEHHDLSTAAGEAFFNMALTFAQMEARHDGERVKFNNEQMVKAGLSIFGKKSLPFGFTVKETPAGKVVAIDEEEEPIARDIIQYYLTHQSKRGTRIYISDKYGITMTEKRLKTFLRSEMLFGKYRDNLSYSEAYIDRETFRRIQEIEKKNVRYDYRQKHAYIFTGLIKCPVCGKELVGFTAQQKRNGNVYKYQKYRCAVNRKKEHHCSFNKAVTQNVIERQLLSVVEDILRDQVIKNATLKEKNAPKRINKDKIYAEIDRLNYSWQTGKIRTVEQYEEQYAKLNAKLQKALDAEKAQEIKDFSHIEKMLSDGWKEIYNALDTEKKRAFWRSFIKNIEIEWTDNTKQITGINFF